MHFKHGLDPPPSVEFFTLFLTGSQRFLLLTTHSILLPPVIAMQLFAIGGTPHIHPPLLGYLTTGIQFGAGRGALLQTFSVH